MLNFFSDYFKRIIAIIMRIHKSDLNNIFKKTSVIQLLNVKNLVDKNMIVSF